MRLTVQYRNYFQRLLDGYCQHLGSVEIFVLPRGGAAQGGGNTNNSAIIGSWSEFPMTSFPVGKLPSCYNSG